MYMSHYIPKKTIELNIENDSIWIQTPLRYFGFKCAMHKHDLCNWKKCLCVCHEKRKN